MSKHDKEIPVSQETQMGMLNTAFIISLELFDRAQREPKNNEYYQSVAMGVALFVGYIEQYSQMHGEMDIKQADLADLAAIGIVSMRANHERLLKLMREEDDA